MTHMVSGSIWMIAARWAMRLIGFVSTMILARLLAPEDFGLVAMALLAYGLLETISYAGVDLALMRPGHNTREHFDTAWTIQVLQGLFIGVCMVGAAPLVADYFDEPRALAVVWWIALRAPIESLQNIGVVAFRKELDFAKEFRFTLLSKLLGFAAVVGSAVVLRNHWALVVGSIVASILAAWLSYHMHPYRPRLSLARFRQIWAFSQWLMISRLGSYLNRRCDEFVVGAQVGTTAMGSYHVVNEIATLPTSEIVMPVRRAMFPTLTKIVGLPDEYSRTVLSSFSIVSAICLFVAITLSCLAADVVTVVLGDRWPDAAPLMRWLALFGGVSAVALVLEVPLWVAGKTRLSAVQSWVEFAAVVPLLLWAVREAGAEGVAMARAAVALVMVPFMMALVARAGLLGFGALWSALWRPAFAAATMAALMGSFSPHWIETALLRLLIDGAICAVVYPAVLMLLWFAVGRPPGVEQSLMDLARRAWARSRNPETP
ncbi:MAG: lipopolysaccharide biosynthesis protein [Burkholderiaceae bacterium]|nr:lipopolysaccharide biosynthesis protein [Burkholderiaceae bacterium]